MTDEQAKTLALADQAWAGLRDYRTDINRIAGSCAAIGPCLISEHDRLIVQMVFWAVKGKLDYDAAESSLAGDSADQ